MEMIFQGMSMSLHPLMSSRASGEVAVIGIISARTRYIVGLDKRGAIILRQGWSRGRVEARFANIPAQISNPYTCNSFSDDEHLRAVFSDTISTIFKMSLRHIAQRL
jgi:hypothetical protein